MPEYIEREELLKDISESVVFTVRSESSSLEIRGANKIIDRIKSAPTADVVEVKHGEWVIKDDDYDCEMMCCSICKSEFYDGDNDTVDHLHNYCPNCGAKMDLKEGAEK